MPLPLLTDVRPGPSGGFQEGNTCAVHALLKCNWRHWFAHNVWNPRSEDEHEVVDIHYVESHILLCDPRIRYGGVTLQDLSKMECMADIFPNFSRFSYGGMTLTFIPQGCRELAEHVDQICGEPLEALSPEDIKSLFQEGFPIILGLHGTDLMHFVFALPHGWSESEDTFTCLDSAAGEGCEEVVRIHSSQVHWIFQVLFDDGSKEEPPRPSYDYAPTNWKEYEEDMIREKAEMDILRKNTTPEQREHVRREYEKRCKKGEEEFKAQRKKAEDESMLILMEGGKPNVPWCPRVEPRICYDGDDDDLYDFRMVLANQ